MRIFSEADVAEAKCFLECLTEVVCLKVTKASQTEISTSHFFFLLYSVNGAFLHGVSGLMVSLARVTFPSERNVFSLQFLEITQNHIAGGKVGKI